MPTKVKLSMREMQIVQMLCRSLTNKEIANELHITERTVKFHVSSLLQKLGVQNRTQIITAVVAKTPLGDSLRMAVLELRRQHETLGRLIESVAQQIEQATSGQMTYVPANWSARDQKPVYYA